MVNEKGTGRLPGFIEGNSTKGFITIFITAKQIPYPKTKQKRKT